jgi:hypothetical protein
MRIDEQAEPLVREILAGVVKRDGDRFTRALAAVTDERTAQEAVRLALAVVGFVLVDQYGREPTAAEVERVATKAAEVEAWSELDAGVLGEVMRAVLDRRPANLDARIAVAAPFVVAGYLLAAGSEKSEWWFDYLDRVEAALERTSGETTG